MNDTPVAEPDRTILAHADDVAAGAACGPLPRARLRVLHGSNLGLEFVLGDRAIVLGRGSDCDLVLEDPAVSRAHVRVVVAGEQLLGEDLGSGNGTFVGGVKVERFNLLDGMQFRVGGTHLQFLVAASEGAGSFGGTPVTLGPRPSLRVPRCQTDAVAAPRARWLRRVALGGAVLGALVALGMVGWRYLPRTLSRTDVLRAASSDVQDAPPGPGSIAPVQALHHARQAIADRKWDAALANLDTLAALDPGHPELDGLRARVRDERRNGRLLERAWQAISADESIDDAASFLARIDESSVYHEESRQLGVRVDRLRIQRDIREVRRLLERKDHRATRDAFLALLRRFPEDPEVLSLKPLVKAAFAPPPPRSPTHSPLGEPQALRSRLAEIHSELAREAADRGDCEGGLRHAREALGYQPDDEVARVIQARCTPSD